MAPSRDGHASTLSKRIQIEFGKRLHEVRRASGIKQATLARALDVSRTSISNIEGGKHRVFLDHAYQAAHALGVDLALLLPTVEQLFPPQAVLTAADDRLAPAATRAVFEVAQDVRDALREPRPTRKR